VYNNQGVKIMSEALKSSPLVEEHLTVVAERLRLAFPEIFSDAKILAQVVEVVGTSMQDLHDEASSYTEAAPASDSYEAKNGDTEEHLLTFEEATLEDVVVSGGAEN
jgi:Ni,Fe-hydrogenase III large subunit